MTKYQTHAMAHNAANQICFGPAWAYDLAMRLISDSTTLRRLHPTDLPAFQAYRNDPCIARYQDWDPMTDERAGGFLGYMAAVTPLLQPGHWSQIAIAETATDDLIGDMGLHLLGDGAEAELGITLAADDHGRGHAVRATTLAVRFLFTETSISRINAYADLRNLASLALMKRAGFSQTGIETTNSIDEAVFVLYRP